MPSLTEPVSDRHANKGSNDKLCDNVQPSEAPKEVCAWKELLEKIDRNKLAKKQTKKPENSPAIMLINLKRCRERLL